MIDQQILERLERIEEKLDAMADERQTKAHYSTAEVAEILKRSEFTVREWCRLRRVNAEKRACGRGRSQEWMISHAELMRVRCEGLLPPED